MTEKQARLGVQAIHDALMEAKYMGPYEVRVKKTSGHGCMIVADFVRRDGRPPSCITIACEVDSTVLRHVLNTAEESAGRTWVSDPSPWAQYAMQDLATTCKGGRARELALTVLEDIEAERLPRPVVNGLSWGISIEWHDGEDHVELQFPYEKFSYAVVSKLGKSDLTTCHIVPRTIGVGDAHVIATYPEYLRGVLDLLFCNYEDIRGIGWDADEVLEEWGFTSEEIAALDKNAK